MQDDGGRNCASECGVLAGHSVAKNLRELGVSCRSTDGGGLRTEINVQHHNISREVEKMRRNRMRKVQLKAAKGVWLACAAILACAVILLTQVQPSYAQQAGYATINGTVTDPAGAVIGGATVMITDTDTGTKRELTTNGSGVYSAPDLQTGHYSVMVSHPGFKTTTQSGIILTADQIAGVNMTMAVGQTTETVTVSASQQMVETESTALSEVVDSTSVEEFPWMDAIQQILRTLFLGL